MHANRWQIEEIVFSPDFIVVRKVLSWWVKQVPILGIFFVWADFCRKRWNNSSALEPIFNWHFLWLDQVRLTKNLGTSCSVHGEIMRLIQENSSHNHRKSWLYYYYFLMFKYWCYYYCYMIFCNSNMLMIIFGYLFIILDNFVLTKKYTFVFRTLVFS